MIVWLLSRPHGKPAVSLLSEVKCSFLTCSVTLLKDTSCSVFCLHLDKKVVQWRHQEVTAPGQEIVSPITSCKPTNCHFYAWFLYGFNKKTNNLLTSRL